MSVMEMPEGALQAQREWDEIQDRMRKGPDGRLVCERCGGRVKFGWVCHFGRIVLATCGKIACAPRGPGWFQGVKFS